MPSLTDLGPFASYLAPGEELRWHTEPGPAALAPEDRAASLRHAFFGAAVGSVLASLAGAPGIILPAVFIALAFVLTRWMRRTLQLSPTRAYAITSTRLLILDAGVLRSFAPNDVPFVKVVTMRDGSVDVFWGEDHVVGSAPSNNDAVRARASMGFVLRGRSTRRGFLALPAAEPAVSLINTWRRAQVVAAAEQAAPTLGSRSVGDMTTRDATTATPLVPTAWRSVREASTGFVMELPASWTVRAARVRKIWIFEPEPTWGPPEQVAWNRLEANPDVSHVGLRVSIAPPTVPSSLEEVLNDKWARALHLRTVEQFPDIRIGRLSGFSVVQDLKGVGIHASFGALRVGTERSEVAALSRQWWLAGPGHAVHVQVVWPTEVPEMRAVLEQAIASMRFEDGARVDGG